MKRIIIKKMQVYNKPCSNCLFSENKLVSEERKKEILTSCENKDVHFICHKSTLSKVGSKNICCHSFYKKYKNTSKRIIFLEKHKLIEFVSHLNLISFSI